ncbi:MAG: hypothetical protein PVI62_15585 [Desulfobacterales bacterium]|jgi:hypothetical protein
MEKPIINYETLIRITKAISMIRDPEEIVLITVEGGTLHHSSNAIWQFGGTIKEVPMISR